jgi:hypothetical protein
VDSVPKQNAAHLALVNFTRGAKNCRRCYATSSAFDKIIASFFTKWAIRIFSVGTSLVQPDSTSTDCIVELQITMHQCGIVKIIYCPYYCVRGGGLGYGLLAILWRLFERSPYISAVYYKVIDSLRSRHLAFENSLLTPCISPIPHNRHQGTTSIKQ